LFPANFFWTNFFDRNRVEIVKRDYLLAEWVNASLIEKHTPVPQAKLATTPMVQK
jgi:hypothetical protein